MRHRFTAKAMQQPAARLRFTKPCLDPILQTRFETIPRATNFLTAIITPLYSVPLHLKIFYVNWALYYRRKAFSLFKEINNIEKLICFRDDKVNDSRKHQRFCIPRTKNYNKYEI